jgi:cysteine desulfurase
MIYLDNQATTRTDPRVVELMLPFFDSEYANPGSVQHESGISAAEHLDQAGRQLARILDCWPNELIFTSGATESNYLAIQGSCLPRRSGHVVSVVTEHPSVLEALKTLPRSNYQVTLLPVYPNGHPEAGRIDLNQLTDSLQPNTVLVSVMLANNEIGVIQRLPEIVSICHSRGILVHSDATQAVGNLPLSLREIGVDLLSFTAHKFYGPKGVGGLFVKKKDRPVHLEGQLVGGGQQQRLRGGTVNLPGIVGMAAALEIADQEFRNGELQRRFDLRNLLYRELCRSFGQLPINGPAWDLADPFRVRLPGNLNCQFPGHDHEDLLLTAPDVACSPGSACRASGGEASHVLQALGLTVSAIRSSLRFSVGRFNTKEQIQQAATSLARILADRD